MTAFFVPVDIGNRAAQHCGSERMDPTLGFADGKTGRELGFAYDKLRLAELERNTWTFATRRVILRPVDSNTMLLAPALWSIGSTYFVGSIVTDSSGDLWVSRLPSNLAAQPGVVWAAWEPYFGPLSVSLYDSTTAYSSGELVYVAVGDGTYRVYMSRQNANDDVPGTATAWDATVTYFANQVVTYSSVAYMSLVDLNLNNQPNTHPTQWTTSFIGGTGSLKWLQIGGAEAPAGVTLAQLNIVYPIGAGPTAQSVTRNVYRLPAGFLRKAPTNPKSGRWMTLGGPSGAWDDDQLIEGGYIVTSNSFPIMLRFVADVVDVSTFHNLFCEMLAARIGLEVAEPFTQSASKLETIAKMYAKFGAEARAVNAIELGSEDPPDDDWVSVRY